VHCAAAALRVSDFARGCAQDGRRQPGRAPAHRPRGVGPVDDELDARAVDDELDDCGR
jgi:hypothetical protein